MVKRSLEFYSLGPLEKEVMEIVWKRNGGSSVRDILDEINSRKSVPYAYTTILTICQNLEKKGVLRSERRGKKNLYFPTVTREQFYRDRLVHFIGNFVRENPDVAASFFAETMDLSPEEAYELLKKFEK